LRLLALGLPLCAATLDSLSDLQQPSTGYQGIVFTQTPREAHVIGDGTRIVQVNRDGQLRVLTSGFAAAADPEVSFDAKHILFAGKQTPGDHWQIYEMNADGSGVRRITSEGADCRHPVYQSKFYNIMFDQPWRQVAFVSEGNLYSTKLDGSLRRQLTFNRAVNYEPVIMPDGRLVFPATTGTRGALFGINLDGTDYAIYSNYEGGAVKRSPAVTDKGLVVFVEGEGGVGPLGAVQTRRNFRSYRPLTKDGAYAWPAPLPGGDLLVSKRNASGVFDIVRMNPASGKQSPVYASQEFSSLQAKVLAPRKEPDGRASVVDESARTGKLYCLNLGTSDTPAIDGQGKRLRLIDGSAAVAGTRILGEMAIEDDGSFQVEVPANTPFKVQVLDSDGLALRTSEWIWIKNKENRGCIGCHEDPELTPENRLAKALTHPGAQLTLAPEQRRTIDYGRDIRPLLDKKCANGSCHASGLAKYIKPGEARNSPLVWSLYGRVTSRPWDKVAPRSKVKVMPPAGHGTLTDEERRTIVEWIDLGAVGMKEKRDESAIRTASRQAR
jgi:hypothetical protein